jgi:hypothetical protein
MKLSRLLSAAACSCAFLLTLTLSNIALADQPVVMTVPGDANNPTIRHPIIAGRSVTLKGAVDAASVGAGWSWDPGDGNEPYTGTVTESHWAVWATHTYDGDSGDFFTATLTVTNDDPVNPVGTATFSMVVRADTVPNRANAAIAEALWYMHRTQQRFDGDVLGAQGQDESIIPMGIWTYPSFGGTLTLSVQGATLNAFEANGHRENGDDSNPYTETVARGMKFLFARLVSVSLDVQTAGPLDGDRSDDPDMNGNGLGVTVNATSSNGVSGWLPPYQLGMIMDGIVASGRPGAVATTGPDGIIGETYGTIVQDMVDWYAMAQSDATTHGGWRYSAWNNSLGSHDNSTSGWAGTGIVAAEDVFGSVVPDWLKTRNQLGLELTDNESDVNDVDGVHGYTNSPSPHWGPFGTTGAALVQMSMNKMEATTSATPDERWVRAENQFRRHFDDAATGSNFKNYYYGIFNFAKAMRTATPAAVTTIGTVPGAADGGIGCGPSPGCAANGAQPLDWYNDPDTGLAQTLVDYQAASGPTIGRFMNRNATGESSQAKHIQPWGTQILTRTLAQAGPIAVGIASPNPAGEGFPITFDHSRSFHQDPNRTLRTFEWDLNGNGMYTDPEDEVRLAGDNTPVTETYDCGGNPLPCSHIINLRVTDDATPPVTTSDVVILDLTIPPHSPTALAGGPYEVCAGDTLTVDGSASFDIDEGTSEPVDPGDPPNPDDFITLYEWELDGASPFNYAEATGVTADWTFDTVGVADIGLKVTDNSALSYPSSGDPPANLTDTDNTFVTVANCITTDLGVTATASGNRFVIPVTAETVTGTVTNHGGEDATDVIIVANLADLVTIVSITPDKGSCAATGIKVGTQDQYKCVIGDLAVNESVDILVEFDAPAVGQGLFEFTVDIEGGPLIALTDSNPGNNTFAVTVDFINEIVVVIKGKGAGATGLLSIALLVGLALFVCAVRRRRQAAHTLSIGLALLLVTGLAYAPAEAQEDDGAGFFVGGALGTVTSDVSKKSFTKAMTEEGWDVSGVKLDDKETGFKVTGGYMFNKYVGIQGSFVDLGELKSEFTANVRPDEIGDLLDEGARQLPGRGRGFLWDFVGNIPLSERVAIYGTVGMFFAEPKTTQKVIVGAEGESRRKGDDDDLAASIGVAFAATDSLTIRVGYERYDIDGNSTDFPSVSAFWAFGGSGD